MRWRLSGVEDEINFLCSWATDIHLGTLCLSVALFEEKDFMKNS